MSDTDLISRILALTKISLTINVNDHRAVYETVDHYLNNDLDPDVRRIMVETDTVVEIICNPHTPVGQYVVYHHDLTAALTEMLRILEGNT